ncbi:MAG: glycoside hydrolase family 88 protein [Cellulophaga sp.]
MKIPKIASILSFLIILSSCNETKPKNNIDSIDQQIETVEKQFILLLEGAEKENRIPRTTSKNGNIHWTNESFDWTEGFFPGSSWYLFELTKNKKWKKAAEKFQKKHEEHKNLTISHDLGFIFNCSYGNGYRLTQNQQFKDVMITAGNSLISRFDTNVGCIKSWDITKGWPKFAQAWDYPVIIDNMMNLELLFELSILTGDSKYEKIAIAHANTTLKNHFREDFSSYHVIDYDAKTGAVRNKHTAQGYAHESAWARGQAWGLYGYTMCYRYTKDEKYLKQAQSIANYIINHEVTPTDGIPYWDYNATNIPNEFRDVSAAAITASALLELDNYTSDNYLKAAEKILSSLATDKYTAKVGQNNNFVLKHSVGSIPHGKEIDVPINYADYYYLEALVRYKQSIKK